MPTDGTCKLTDDGSNTINISCTISEVDQNFNHVKRSLDQSIKSYVISDKKKFVLTVKNIGDTDHDTLKTIYDLKSELSFYRNTSDGTSAAAVRWVGDFNFHTPTNKSYSFLNRIYEGKIELQEV